MIFICAVCPALLEQPPGRRLAVFMARAIALKGLGRIEPLTWQVARMWMPVNLIFVAMLATNFYALEKVVRGRAGGRAFSGEGGGAAAAVRRCGGVGGGGARWLVALAALLERSAVGPAHWWEAGGGGTVGALPLQRGGRPPPGCWWWGGSNGRDARRRRGTKRAAAYARRLFASPLTR